MSLLTLALYPDHLIYKAHSPHQLPLYVHSVPNSEVNTIHTTENNENNANITSQLATNARS